MAFSLVGWSESQDSAVLIAAAAIPDAHVTVQGDDVRVPEFAPLLAGVYAVGQYATRVQLVAPSLRRVANVEVSPLDVAAVPTPLRRCWAMWDSPLPLEPDESLNAHMAENGSGATRVSVFAWLADGPMSRVEGEIYSVRVTASAALVGLGWDNRGLVFDQTLPAGQYAVVGAVFRSATLLAFRLVFPGAYHRPGGIGVDGVGDVTLDGQRLGGWGEWGRFGSTTPPTVDFFSTAADAAPTGELDLVRVS